MVGWLVRRILGTKNEREIKKLKPFVRRVNELERRLDELPNYELIRKAQELYNSIRLKEDLKEEILRGRITEWKSLPS